MRSKTVKWLGALAMVSAAIALVLIISVSVPLDFIESRLESVASKLLDRSVEIHGPIRLRISLQPGLELGRIIVANPHGWPDDSGSFLAVEESRGVLDLAGLLKGDIHIRNLEFTGVELRLINRADQSNNYQFTFADADKGTRSSKHELSGLDRISLHNLRLSYIDEQSEKNYTLEIDEAIGHGFPERPLQFGFSGNFNGKACLVDFTGGTLQELLSKSESWPVEVGHVSLGNVSLDLSGSLNLANQGKAGYVDLALKGDKLKALGDVFDLALPEIGEFSLNTRIGLQPGNVQFSGLQFMVLQNIFKADLVLSLFGDRPHLGGKISAKALTPDIIALFQTEKNGEIGTDDSKDPLSPVLDLGKLRLLDTDIRFRASEIYLGVSQIKDLHGVISLVDGDLVLPVSLETAQLPIEGQFEISAADSEPTILAEIASQGGSLDQLLGAFSENHKMQGQLGALSLVVESTGNTAAELMERLDIKLHLGSSTLEKDSDIIISTDSLTLERQHHNFLEITTTGELLGSALDLALMYNKTGSDRSSLDLDLNACDTKLLLGWEITERIKDNSAFTIELEGEKLCDFLDPVEQFLGRDFAYAIKAAGNLTSGKLDIDVEAARLGEIDLNGSLALTSDHNNELFINGAIHSKGFDLQRLQHRSDPVPEPGLPPSSNHPAAKDSGQDALEQKIELLKDLLAMEVLPIKKFFAANARLNISLEQLSTGFMDVSDIHLTLETAKGKLKHSPFQAVIGGSLFTGSAAVDTTTASPQMHLALITNDFSLADLLQDFQLSEIPDIRAEHVGLDLDFQGNTVQEMLQQASYHAELRRGKAVLPRDPLIPLKINIEQADYVSYPGQPAMISLNGDVNELDISAKMTGEGVFARGTEKPVVVALQAELAETRLEIDGQINRKKDLGESFRLSTVLSGRRMDDLDELLGINMPPLGPYQIGGTLASRKEDSVGLYDMGVKVGNSKLLGEFVISAPSAKETASGNISHIQTSLYAPTIQLNDFRFGEWSPVTGNREASEEVDPDTAETAPEQSVLLNVLSADLAKQINGALTIEVQEVWSGRDMLGHGNLSARLQDGRYVVDVLKLAIPGGAVNMNGDVSWEGEEITTDVSMSVTQFDYGILGRRIKPDSTLKGEVNLLLDINSRARTPEQLKQHINGRLKFGIVPESYKAGVLDLWSVNILTAALPALLKGSSSIVNCVVGDFLLEDGIMHPEVFLLDTSKMRVRGTGDINFKTDSIDFHMRPTPKSAQFFSLATPISVSGTIKKPHIRVTPAGVAGTVFRQAISVVTVPLQWLFSEKMEADGEKVCSAAMQWVQTDSDESN